MIRRVLATVAALAALAAACGGGESGPLDAAGSAPSSTGSDGASTTGASADGASLAEAEALDLSVAVTGIDGATVELVREETAGVDAGDRVATDGTGFAEVRYPDGSVTRLDVNTELEIVELSDGPGGPVVRTTMGVGRTWNRVQRVTGSDAGFEAGTSVATAVVRGTAFTVECSVPGVCRFVVLEGSLDVVLDDGTVVAVAAGQLLDVDGASDEIPVPQAVPPGGLATPWALENLERDEGAGFPPLGTGTLAGAWVGMATVTFDDTGRNTEGSTKEAGMTVIDSCGDALNCQLGISLTLLGVGPLQGTATWTGGEYTVTLPYSIDEGGCSFSYVLVRTFGVASVDVNGNVLTVSGEDVTSIEGLGAVGGFPGPCFESTATVAESVELGRS